MRRWLGCVLGIWLGAVSAQPLPVAVPEATMKAHYLFNFMRYVTWPSETPTFGAEQTLNLCMLGHDDTGIEDALMALHGKSTGPARVVNVLRLPTVKSAKTCHLLFVAESEAPKMGYILGTLGPAPVLVVADTPVAQDAIIMLSLQGQRLVFDISLSRAKAANLLVSSKLLQLARKTD